MDNNFIYKKALAEIKIKRHVSHRLLRQNILDAKKLLLANAKKFHISAQLRNIYIHRDNLFLLEKLKLPLNILWIIKLINNINNHRSLVEFESIFIPEDNDITKITERCQIQRSKINSTLVKYR